MRSAIQEFLHKESAGGIVLALAAAIALLISNSPLANLYDSLLATAVALQAGDFKLAKPLLLWINDGLMAVFFLLVGLEIKREILEGELSSVAQSLLPGVAAIGGMVLPAAIYTAFNWSDPVARAGWAIPAATDIAFALGVLSLLGKRVPISLKIFLTAVAVIDDLGAIVIIALFYTADLSTAMLFGAALATLTLLVLNLAGVTRIAAYVIVGTVLWVTVLKSGVHATLAGVILAFAIPLRARDEENHSPLKHLEHTLHPWVAFGVLPIFAFANAGVSFSGMSPATLVEPVPLGITLGLFLGKLIGVFGASFLLIKAGVAKLPESAGWTELAGVALLCGIGFTMSLFIGSLAFEQQSGKFDGLLRLGVISGSIASAVVGYVVLAFAAKRRTQILPG
ncbi:MAG: Na+/H+ antiporter NhaA [Burkholderiales bacterium]